jgi:hypothetical protein
MSYYHQLFLFAIIISDIITYERESAHLTNLQVLTKDLGNVL